jgi:uncharacterized protein YjeT (DUF2065 family)
MPDVHVPDFGARHGGGRSLLKIALEVLLIATGVFLGLAGEQWREHARHREMAAEALRRFRTEVTANRKAAADVKDYHVTLRTSLNTHFSADPKTRRTGDVQVQGLRPASFEHTAWDLALATQSLADIDPQVAFALSRIYTTQQGYADMSREILQTMYLRPPSENLEAFFRAMVLYYGDVVLIEPKLLEMYDDLLPRLDRALGGAAR